jgi:phosphotransferase system IIB component
MDWQYIVIICILLIFSFVIIKINKKDFSLEINKLIQYLGGKDNIIDAEVNMSRLKVVLKNMEIIDKEGIQKLGAKGIVEIDNQLKIIFGSNSKQLKKYINDLK